MAIHAINAQIRDMELMAKGNRLLRLIANIQVFGREPIPKDKNYRT
jgi:hypothetical protein